MKKTVVDHNKISKRSNNTSKRFDVMDKGIETVIELYYKGYSRETTYEYLIKHLGLKPTNANGVLDSALRKIRDEIDSDRLYIFNLHIKRYDEISEYCENIKVSNPNDIFQVNKKYDALLTHLECLVQKERLLGFHTKTFKVKFKDYLKGKEKEKNNYDFSKLTDDEMLIINSYLSEEQFDEHIEVDDEIMNVKKETTKQDVEPSSLQNEIEIKPKIKLKKIEKDIQQSAPGLTIEDIKRKIIENSRQ